MPLALWLQEAAPPPASPTGPVAGLAWIDLVGLGLVGVLTLLGLVRGLWWQVIRLLGLLAAIVVARTLSPRWVPGVQTVFPDLDPRLTHGILWILVFLAALGVASLLGRLGRRVLEAMQLGLVDRLGGALTGALTGLLVHAAFLVGLTHLGPAAFVSQHLGGTYSDGFLDVVARRWPVVLAKEQGEDLRALLYGERAPAGGGDAAAGGEPDAERPAARPGAGRRRPARQ